MLLVDSATLVSSLMIFLLVAVCSAIVWLRTRSKGIFFFDAFFIGIIIYFIGVLIVFTNPENFGSFTLLFITTLLFIIVFFLWMFNRIFSNNGLTIDTQFAESKNHLFAVSSTLFIVLINLAFIYLVYVRIIQGHFAGAFALLDIRKTISSGEAGYFAPGLIKQIRDILAPAVIVWLIMFFEGRNRKLLIVLLFFSTLGAMLFGGQRMPILVMFLAVAIAYKFRLYKSNRSISKRLGIILIFAPLCLLMGLNIMLGRTEGDQNIFLSFLDLLINLVTRVFATVPLENVHVVDYITELKMDYFALWLSDLAILLPGTQEAFSNQLHSYLGGSSQGNAVLGTPLDIFVNSGYWGLLLVPFIVLFVLNVFQFILLSGKNPFSISLMIVVFFYLPFCYSFYLFLLNGGLFVIVYSTYNILTVRRQQNG